MTASSDTPGYATLIRDGLWWNNPGLAQLLGLCPLLAVSRTLAAGIGLGIATAAVLVATNGLIAAARRYIDPGIRLPACVLVIAAFVTAADLLVGAFWFELYLDVGLFIPLIVTNCVILARAEAFATRQPVAASLVDGLAHGAGFLVLLAAMGAIRELLARGTVFADAQLLFGAGSADLGMTIPAEPQGLLLASLPPGAFFVLALLVAARNAWLSARRPATPQAAKATDPAPVP
jgi:electron transport complex protein RnfE